MRPLVGVAALAVSFGAGAARGDALHATRQQPLVEIAHTVDIRVDEGVATYTVRRQYQNPGARADEANLAIDLPYGSAATGLRIRARDTWFDGELMERQKAAALYHELTGLGAWKPKDPALLQWQWADKLRLQIFPVLPRAVSTVEYTLTGPTRYAGGKYWVSYPRVNAAVSAAQDGEGATHKLATPVVTVRPAWGAGAAISLDGKAIQAFTPVTLTPPVRPAWADLVGAQGNASYVASAIVVPDSSHTTKTFATAKVTLDIRHTFQGDLKVEVLTPEGKSVVLHDRTGGSKSDVRGVFDVKLPPGTHAAGTWRLVVSDHAALDSGSIDGWEIAIGDTTQKAKDTPVFVPDAPESASDAGVATFAIAAPAIATMATRFGRVVASGAHAYARLEVDVAPQLVPTPVKSQVVFVVDASYSIGEEGLAAELDVARAYLTHVPDAEVEVVVYRRHAARLFGALVPAAGFDAAIAAAKRRGELALGNGSAIDEASRLAASVLQARQGPRRVVLLTDELPRSSMGGAAAAASLASLSPSTVVHVVVPESDDRVSLRRDDAAELAQLATKHHGIFARVHGFPLHGLKALVPVALELVRPTRIEFLKVDGVRVSATTLHEGDGLRVMDLEKKAPARIVLTGKLWSDDVRREVLPTEKFSRQTAAFVFGANEYRPLSNDEQMRVAMMGRAVSPVTSYVAFEPGTRPSTIGLEDSFGAGGLGLSGIGAGGGGRGMGVGLPRPDLGAMVDKDACIRSVRPKAGWSARFVVETTRDEIVDVAAPGGTDAAMTACLVEEAWRVRLDARFDLTRESFAFTLAG